MSRATLLLGKSVSSLPLLSINPGSTRCARPFYAWLNGIFNKVDSSRIASVGADRAAAEWLLRCGASVKWVGRERVTSDYNNLGAITGKLKIESVDATDSAIMGLGFDHFRGLQELKALKFRNCMYLEDEALLTLALLLSERLEVLELIDLKLITDRGLNYVLKLQQLRVLRLLDLPTVQRPQEFLDKCKMDLPSCIVEWPPYTSRSEDQEGKEPLR